MNSKYNKAHNKNYFILTFFVILSIGAVIRLIDNAIQLDAWQYGEWLINYQNGFVRRGLIGEGIYLISLILNMTSLRSNGLPTSLLVLAWQE